MSISTRLSFSPEDMADIGFAPMTVWDGFDAACTSDLVNEYLAKDDLTHAWQHGILQTIDYYKASARAGFGPRVFDRKPDVTDSRMMSAFAALAEYFAHRDGWVPPKWCDEDFHSPLWLVNPHGIVFVAYHESPDEFIRRGVLIEYNALERA